MTQPDPKSRLSAELVRDLTDSLTDVQELFRASMVSREDTTATMTRLSQDIEHLGHKVSRILNTIHGTDGGRGMKEEVLRLTLALEVLTASVADLKTRSAQHSDELKDAGHERDLIRRDQSASKSLIDNIWKLVLILAPGLVALIVQLIKWIMSEAD